MEIWKPIKGFEGQYEVSNIGRVRNLKGERPKICGQHNHVGYLCTNLNKHPYLVHRLVAEAFIPNPESKPFINHINGDRRDNLLPNLEWVTALENSTHAIKSGLSNQGIVNRRKKVAQYDAEGNFIAEYESINAAAIAMGAKGQHGNLRKVCKGERKYFQGYVWKFV